MARTFSKFAFVVVAGVATTAAAEPTTSTSATTKAAPTPLAPGQGRRVVVDTPLSQFATPDSQISPYVYLNRCTGGCTVHGGATNDARTQHSGIPAAGDWMIGEYANAAGETGAMADAEWAQLVQCMKEVYSPYAVTLSDTIPAGGSSYTEAIIAGNPQDIGLGQDILGIAPLSADCSAQDNVISFSFANHHGNMDRVNNICWTAAQETAHAFGLDHEYQFADGSSACDDPMTYRVDCGGEKFFRNKPASCGEDVVRTCHCGGSQNSHSKIKSVFGAGVSIVANPTATVLFPAAGSVANNFTVQAAAGSQRGVASVEMWLNGYNWIAVGGAAFSTEGQPDPSNYALTAPSAVPDGIIDIVIKAYDDLGNEGDAATVTVQKGAPCASAANCAAGQKCDSGKCYWDPPTGGLGDVCTYAQFCTSGICEGTSDSKICTQDCVVSSSDACPTGYDCIQTTGTTGVCFTSSGGGGCCSVDRSGSSCLWLHGGLSALVLGLLIRRRRRT